MSPKEYYVGGIPERIFNPGFASQRIKGKSGFFLECEVNNEIIVIFDPQAKRLFEATRKKNTIAFSIYNKDPNGERHPDIYAAKLVKRSLKYFESQGFTINEIHSRWEKPSDNYKQYEDFLQKKRKPLPTIDDLKVAAKNTWTGKIAKKHGYTKVKSLQERKLDSPPYIEVVFKKQ